MTHLAQCLFVTVALGGALAVPCPGQEPATDPDVQFPEGQPSTDTLDAEREMGLTLTKRVTRDCVIAIVGSDGDAKELAKFAVRASRAARTTWPADLRDQPLEGAAIPIYSIPYGDALDAWMNAVVKPRGADEALCNAIRAQHAWYWQDLPPFVYIERNKALKIHTKDQGSHAAHGLGHAFFNARARIGHAASPVWMSEGYACWLERHVMPKCRLGCVPVHVLGGYVKRTEWDNQITNLVRSGNDPPLAKILEARTAEDLKEAMVPKAASLCGWLARTRPTEFWKLPHAINALGGAEGVKMVLQKSVSELDAEWRAWVPTVKAPVLGAEPDAGKPDAKDDGKDDD